jgi:riboflavin kinase / FMN adenylyltransferase
MKIQFLVWGKVKSGSKRGRLLGFPTANIVLHKNIPEGVYISKVKVDRHWFSALTFVGAAKTFGEKNKKVESYILNFDRNIYEKWITVKLFQKIRDNIKFSSEKELVEQMKKDLNFAQMIIG